MDKILMEGMEFYGDHGVLNEEKFRGQKFIVDIEIYTDLTEAAQNDDVESTVSYAEVYKNVEKIFQDTSYNLIEALAQKTADAVLEFAGVEKVLVRVKKPHAPISGKFDMMGVEIFRECQK